MRHTEGGALHRVGGCLWSYDSESPNITPLCIGNRASVRTLPIAACVVILFKTRRCDGSCTAWMFPHIYQVAIVNGRLSLTRVGYGLVLSLPAAQVEAYSTDAENTPTHATEA
jgi:hypothetical protein